MRDVEGKVAFITGGASGIGYGMARVFLAAGMKVVIADLNRAYLDEARLALRGNNAVHFIELDVADRAAVEAAADETERVFGKVHIVCNNAGVSGAIPMDEAAWEDWDWVAGVNLGGVINGVKVFIPRLKAHGEGGHIVNTSSMAGLIPLPDTGGIYSMTKFAVRGLTDSLRLTLARDNIGVSVLCPGLTRTRILESVARPGTAPAEGATGDGAVFNNLDAGMDPMELGEAVLRGIRRNDAYILPHGEFKEEVRGLFEEILAAFPDDKDAPAERVAFEDRRRRMTEDAKAGKPRG